MASLVDVIGGGFLKGLRNLQNIRTPQSSIISPIQDVVAPTSFLPGPGYGNYGPLDKFNPEPVKTPTSSFAGGIFSDTTATGGADISKAQKIIDDMNAGRIPWDDNLRAWANNMLSGGGTQADSLIKTAVEGYTKLFDQYTKKSKDFDEKNPFSFDKFLEEETARVSQRLDPYYKQTLADYTTGIERKKSRSLEDENTMLTELATDTQSLLGESRIAFDDALESSREGFATAGLYGSGKQLRAEGKLAAQEEEKGGPSIEEAAAEKERKIKLGTKRTLEDIAFDKSIKEREFGAEKEYQTKSQALSEVLRRQRQREFEKAQYTGAPPGVDPFTYQTNSFNLLP